MDTRYMSLGVDQRSEVEFNPQLAVSILGLVSFDDIESGRTTSICEYEICFGSHLNECGLKKGAP